MFLVFSLTIEIIEIKETLTEKIVFNITKSENNNDEESSDNIENLDFAVTTVINVVVNAVIVSRYHLLK